jgi:dTDP-4-dehydrorhamnose reductase
MYQYLRAAGLSVAELFWIDDHPCSPDIIGVNHYVTSDRFLDHRLERYPAHVHGGNGRDRYVDVETARVRPIHALSALGDAWRHYHLPIAVTECHLWSTREEQLRWLLEVWRAARQQQDAGVDVRAVTAWSLFGAYDWHNLLTRESDRYETGAFDARLTPPFPTALTGAVHAMAAGREPAHQLLELPGWWRHPPTPQAPDDRALVITGSHDVLDDGVGRIATLRNIPHVVAPHAHVAERQPWAVLDLGLPDEDALALASVCASRRLPLATCSTERVFDVYPDALVLRTGQVDPSDSDDVNDLIHTTLNLLLDGARGLVQLADYRLTR